MHDLQFYAGRANDADFRRGALITLTSAGLFRQGLNSSLVAMPMFAINDSTDYDAASDTGNTSGGVNSAFVASGGYELMTTAVDLENFDAADFAINAPLTGAEILNAGAEQEGLLAPVSLSSGKIPLDTNCVGVVAKSVYSSVYGQQVINFWPCYNPARV
jgi:hypothetical protein